MQLPKSNGMSRGFVPPRNSDGISGRIKDTDFASALIAQSFSATQCCNATILPRQIEELA